ncbi:MAG: GH39 family glycosyl hydrolase [Candidatus Dormibacteria bacterium]
MRHDDSAARQDWERRTGRRSGASIAGGTVEALKRPGGLEAHPGVGHVTLTWDPLPAASGYAVYRAESPDGPFELLRHGGADVPAVPAPPFADTDVTAGRTYWYEVAAAAGPDATPGERSQGVSARPIEGLALPVEARVDVGATRGRLDRVWRMVGSERLSQLDEPVDRFGNDIGAEFAQALAHGHAELGVTTVRAHAILHDDLDVFKIAPDGQPRYDFSRVDSILERLLALGLRPVIELSFMPRDLASDPSRTVFGYRGIVSPPRDWDQWGELVGRLAAHLVRRFGLAEVVEWGFEVWNEPNLEVFWTGTKADYYRLYDTAARAIKAVDGSLRVGGPATAAAEWLDDFASHVAGSGVPLDFLSTHTYGNVPIDALAILQRHGLSAEVWWTEWGISPTHFGDLNDGAFGAPFILRGLKAAQGRVTALAYWVISDHFEELGRGERLFHNGFGLLTVGNLRKPRYWAVRLAAELGDQVVHTEVSGDGAGGLVELWATRASDGRIDVLAWNSTLNAAKHGGDHLLDRTVQLRVEGLVNPEYRASLARVDQSHSNITARSAPDLVWPSPEEWATLRAADHLHQEDLGVLRPVEGQVALTIDLPMPGIIRLRLVPGVPTDDGTQQHQEAS